MSYHRKSERNRLLSLKGTQFTLEALAYFSFFSLQPVASAGKLGRKMGGRGEERKLI